jgi:hypothetical protein
MLGLPEITEGIIGLRLAPGNEVRLDVPPYLISVRGKLHGEELVRSRCPCQEPWLI